MWCAKTEMVHVARNPYRFSMVLWSSLMYSSVSSVASEEPFRSSFGDGCLAMNVGMLWVVWGTSCII